MPTMTVTITDVDTFGGVQRGYKFTGKISLPQVVDGAIKINSMSLYYGYGRAYVSAPYLTAVCGDTTFRTDYFSLGSDSSLKKRTLNVLSWEVGTDHILRENGRTITFTAQRNESTSANIIDRPRAEDMTLTVNYTILQSGLSLSTTNLEAGSMLTAYINAGDPVYTHKLMWTFGSRSETVSVSAGVAETVFEFPMEWLDQIPNALTGLGSCRLETYSGDSLMGAETAYFDVSVPVGVIPVITSLTATRLDNSVPEDWGLYVQGQSGVRLEAEGAGAYGSTVTSWRFTGDGGSSQSPMLTVDKLTGSGDIVFTVDLTDSRGRTARDTMTIHVTPYMAPVIRQCSTIRADSTGGPEPTGTYLLVQAESVFSDCAGRNSGYVTLSWREKGTLPWLEAVAASPANTGIWLIANGGADVAKAYEVQIQLYDTFADATMQEMVPTAECFIDRMPGRKRLGIFGYNTRDDSIYVPEGIAVYLGEKELAEEIKRAQEAAEEAQEAAGSITFNPLDVYPVGALYWSADPTSPASLFGGSWTQITDRFVLAAGSSYSNGGTGGAASRTVNFSNGVALVNFDGSGSKIYIKTKSYSYTPNARINGSSVVDCTDVRSNAAQLAGSQSISTLPPYIVKYCWERTA